VPKTVARLIFRMSVLPGVEFSGSPIRSPKDSGFDRLLRFTYPHTQVEFEDNPRFRIPGKKFLVQISGQGARALDPFKCTGRLVQVVREQYGTR